MDISTAASLVRVVAENSGRYSVSMQRTLLEAIFQLATLCDETLNDRPDVSAYAGIKTSLMHARLFASKGLKYGDLDDAFRLAAECFAPAAAVASDLDYAFPSPKSAEPAIYQPTRRDNSMKRTETAPLVGTHRALIDAGDKTFSVVVEINEPVVETRRLDQLIEGLAGDRLRSLVRRPSEAVFVTRIDPLEAGEKVADRLETPIENPSWWPGARVLAITSI